MSGFTGIILRMLWRLYPIAWLATAIVQALSAIAAWLEEEDDRWHLAQDREECAWIGGWLALAEERLNELIAMKAMKLLKRSWRPRNPCGHHRARAVRTPEESLARLARLCVLCHDHKRLYDKRAQKLQRLFQAAGLQLEAVHHPVEPTIPTTTILRSGASTTILGARARTSTTTILRLGSTWTIFRLPGDLHPAQPIRAPPWLGLRSENQSPSQPARPSRETGRSCLKMTIRMEDRTPAAKYVLEMFFGDASLNGVGILRSGVGDGT